MKLLITGAHGQVGSDLVTLAIAAGYIVSAASRSELDISQQSIVTSFLEDIKPDLVINAAAYTAVDKAEEEQDLAYAINRDGAKYLAIACARQNIPLFHISTDYVFDGTQAEPYKETDTPSPLGVYGNSKWQGEEAIREQLHDYIILRVAWVFGEHGNNFVKTMLRLGNERDSLSIVADQSGGPTPAKNIAETLITLARQYQESKTLKWGTYHYCGSPQTTWFDFADNIFRQAKDLNLLNKNIKLTPITTEQYPTAAKRPANSMLDCSAIKATFNINMPDWRMALKTILTNLQ